MLILRQAVPTSTVSLSITVNIHADRSLLFIVGLLWLAWLPVAGVGRWVWGWVVSVGYGFRQAPGMMLEDWTRFWFRASWNYA